MKKSSGLASAVRLTARCLAIPLLSCAVASAWAATSRPEHTHHVATQEAAKRPDFARAAAAAKKHGKSAPSPREHASREHQADEGASRSGAAKPHSPAHKPAPKRRHNLEPDDDYAPLPMSRVKSKRQEPARATDHHQRAANETPRLRESEKESERRESERASKLREEAARRETPRSEPRHTETTRTEAAVEARGPLHADDFLRAARGEAHEPAAAPQSHASVAPLRTDIPAGPPRDSRLPRTEAPYATGVAHPSEQAAPIQTPPDVSAAAAQPYIDEHALAASQRAAIGQALRPQSEPVTVESYTSAPPSPAATQQPAPVQQAYVQQAFAQQAFSQQPARSVIAARTAASDTAAEDAVRSSVLAPMTRQEIAEAAVAPHLPGLYSRDGELIVPAPLKGSHEVLVHQNEMADAAGLGRIRNDADLDKLRRAHRLVDFPETEGLRVNPELPERRRCARPWTVTFAADMGRAFYTEFHEPIMVSSAVRTVSYQRRLQHVNGNAAATSGEAASPHLTGQAFDIGKTGLSRAQIAWLRTYLLPMIQNGAVDVEEEFQQACFHISVYPSYTSKHAIRTQVAASME